MCVCVIVLELCASGGAAAVLMEAPSEECSAESAVGEYASGCSME